MGEVGAFGRDGGDNDGAVQKDSRANWIMNLVLIGRGARVRLPDSLVSVAVMKTAEAASGAFGVFERQSGRSVGSSLLPLTMKWTSRPVFTAEGETNEKVPGGETKEETKESKSILTFKRTIKASMLKKYVYLIVMKHK